MNVKELVDNLSNLEPKRLRTIRNSINNRLSSIGTGKEEGLTKSHPLYGIEKEELLDIKQKIEQVLNCK